MAMPEMVIRIRLAWWVRPAVFLAYVPRACRLISTERFDRICRWLVRKGIIYSSPKTVAEAEQHHSAWIAREVAESEIIL